MPNIVILINKWLKYQGIKFLEEVGIKKGDIVFDCFCGEGNYTIPAAKIVNRTGLVYAMDRDIYKTETLRKRAATEEIKNIEIFEEEFNDKLPLTTSSINAVLLYDIFWYYSPGDRELLFLLEELHRIIKGSGILSVYPEHIDSNQLLNTIMNKGFSLDREFPATLIHDNNLKKGYILNFKKERKFT